MAVFLFLVLHWYLSLFFQTFWLHRYAAHRMFTMSPFWERVFYVASFIFQGSSYLSPYAYGVLHRRHHAYADTELDPHSPKYDKTLWSMMLRTQREYSDIFRGRVVHEEKFTRDLPHWRPFELMAENWMVRVGWCLVYILIYTFIATEWWMYLFLPVHFLMGPLHGAIINWFAHKYGGVRFRVNDTSKNLLPVDVLMLGESYHNNHHKNPNRANFGITWWEFDPVYPFVLLFNVLGVIRMPKKQSATA